MSILSSVSKNDTPVGIRAVIAGIEKAGKTTLACSAPRALLVPLEIGYQGLNVHKVPMLHSFNEVMQLLSEITTSAQKGEFPYQTLIFDSTTALERLIHDAVLRSDPTYGKNNKKALTMEAALGGYGKAYQYSNELFGNFLKACDGLAIHGKINIVLTCHVFAAKVIDPAFGEYDTWDLLLHSPKNQKSYGKREMLTQWADLIGFLHEPVYVTKGENLNQAVSAEKGRVLGVNRSPGYVAGNRFGLKNEIPIGEEKGWNYIADAIHKSRGIDYFNRD